MRWTSCGIVAMKFFENEDYYNRRRLAGLALGALTPALIGTS